MPLNAKSVRGNFNLVNLTQMKNHSRLEMTVKFSVMAFSVGKKKRFSAKFPLNT